MFRLACLHECSNCLKNNLAVDILKIKYKCDRLKSYYQALGLDSTASAKDIKAAYYKLSLKFHPDKNMGNDESVAKFREITEAYEVLGNPEKKRKYDQDYRFHPNYHSRYSKAGQFYRSSNHYGPFTGRTRDFNYDEHYKKHYEDYQRQREIEYEYFRRRWEGDFHRRYKDFNDYYRNRGRNEDPFEKFTERDSLKRSPYPIVYAACAIIGILYLLQSGFNPENFRNPRMPLYYKVSSENDNSEEEQK